MTNIKEGYDSCRFLLKLLLEKHVTVHPIMTESNAWFIIDPFGFDPEKASHNV
jgi:hypothetical protein